MLHDFRDDDLELLDVLHSVIVNWIGPAGVSAGNSMTTLRSFATTVLTLI